MGVLDFLLQAREAGRNARSDLEGGINYYIPPELRGLLGLAAEANPVVSMERAGQDAQRLVAPGMSGWDRMAAAGDMASNMAGVLAPVAGAGRAGVPVANAIQDVLVGASRSPAASGVMDFAADEFGGAGFKAYHGSPHDFDKFSMDKIGTGEGAQAYGHGLYFAENEGIARSYRDALAKGDPNDPVFNVYDLVKNGLPPQEARKIFQEIVDDGATHWPESKRAERLDFARRTLEALDSGAVDKYTPPGSMYEVQINADPEAFLDWDKPLSEQPQAVRDVLGDSPYLTGAGEMRRAYRNPMFGGDLLKAPTATPDELSRGLAERGIPGIKYLDAGSRTAGDGSRNYVVFDDAMIEILRKYGLLAPALGAGAWAAGSPTSAQAASGGLLEDRR